MTNFLSDFSLGDKLLSILSKPGSNRENYYLFENLLKINSVDNPYYFFLYCSNKLETIFPIYLMPSNFSPTIGAEMTIIGLTLFANLTALIMPIPFAISTTTPEVSKNPGVSQRYKSS